MIRRPKRKVRGERPVAVLTATVPVTILAFYREIIRQTQDQGFDVCLVASSGAELRLVAEELDVRYYELQMCREKSPLADMRALFAWLRLLFRERPSFLFSATPKASLLSQVAGKVAGVNRRLYCVVGLRLEGESGWRRKILTYAERLTCWASTEVVANSDSLAKRILSLDLSPEWKLRQTHPGSSHGVDSRHFAPRPKPTALASTLGLEPSLPIIGFIGRVTHDKGIGHLIEAIGILNRRGITSQLIVAGAQDEPDSAAYLKRIASMSVKSCVTGAVNDVRPYLALFDVNVLPTLREGFPNAVLEASAMGIATITTDATGAIDSVRHGITGLIVRAGDSEDLANALEVLLTSPDSLRRYGTAAREWVSTDYQPQPVVRSLLAFEAPHSFISQQPEAHFFAKWCIRPMSRQRNRVGRISETNIVLPDSGSRAN